MGKIPIKSIRAITFTAGRPTKARRTEPIPQLSCVGKACRVFQPDVVQCENMGDDDEGNIQWRCDTDLPPGFRLGRVEVSCEGWAKPGDKMINQGSCALEYNLYQSNPELYESTPSIKSRTDRLLDKGFALLFWLVTLILLYTLLRAIVNRLFPRYSLPRLSSFFPPSDGPGHGHHHGWGGGPGPGPGGPGFNNGPAPPPPYTKNAPETQSTQTAGSGPGLGLWAGLAAGGLAGWFAGRQGTGTQTAPRAGPSQARQRPRRSLWDGEDTGAGPSQPREMRRATGFGGTTVR